ncbi:uncharacterized protein PRCAT00003463001 [Priceomyces carsonii]|uniref:uncharacterized protein n=1 Tax=Priceomyces carsonii TaxID=28549 RepID=UPI002EDBB802|nr:unnamed protein product [Priceomyces carsonii]
MPLPIIVLILKGISKTMCSPSLKAYCIDSLPDLKRDAIASNYMIGFTAAVIVSAPILIRIQAYGIEWASSITSIFLWVGYGCSLILIYYGAEKT